MKNFYKIPLIKIVGTLLNNTWVKAVSKGIQNYFKLNGKKKHNFSQSVAYSGNSV